MTLVPIPFLCAKDLTEIPMENTWDILIVAVHRLICAIMPFITPNFGTIKFKRFMIMPPNR